MRGVGPSGVSRTLVLIDDVPFNDPFGGWVYWSRIPMASVERVEMIEGTNSSVYGNYALGGVINIVTTPCRRPDRQSANLHCRTPNTQGRCFRRQCLGQVQHLR